MIVTLVHVYVKSENVQDFISATLLNHHNSVKEAENERFDVLQDPNDKTHFILYEAYQSKAGAAAHKQTKHYLTWREKVASWMAKPREGISYTVLAP